MAGVLTAVFVAWEIFMGERAMTPTAIFKSRSVYVPFLFTYFVCLADWRYDSWAILAYSLSTQFFAPLVLVLHTQ